MRGVPDCQVLCGNAKSDIITSFLSLVISFPARFAITKMMKFGRGRKSLITKVCLMKKLFVRSWAIGLVTLLVLPSVAFESINWIGKGDINDTFGDPKNYGRWETVDGKPTFVNRLPEAGWRIYVESGTPPMYIRDGDAALASSLQDFYLSGTGTVYWVVSTNSVLNAQIRGTGGQFIKMISNTVLQFANDAQFAYDGFFTVAEGTIKLQNYVGRTLPFNYFVAGVCTVSNDATLVICNADTVTTTGFVHLKNYGLVTNENVSVRHIVTFRTNSDQFNHDVTPSIIAGSMGGNIKMQGQGCVDFISEVCTYKTFAPQSDESYQCVIGLARFGNKDDTVSSMGAGTILSSAANGIMFKYLGTGETTDKTFEFKIDNTYATRNKNHITGLDGGPHGGAIFTGTWKSTATAGLVPILHLTGTNATPCEYSGLFSAQVSGITNYAPHVLKTGSGVWRFNERFGRSDANYIGLSGAFSIEEGTLQFDTLGEVGENCALGTAGDLFDKYMGAYDPEKKVAWAYSLGVTNETGTAEKEGTLEFVGTETAFASRRPVSLLGNGRLKNSGSASLTLRGVSARVDGEHLLTLDGVNTMSNAVAEISDGTNGAIVSIVKEGDGKWMLKGNTTFSGDIVVKGGELEVEANTNRFDWFRFTFRKTGNTYARPFQLALYDVDGTRQNKNLSYPSSWTSFGSSPQIFQARHEGCHLQPGEMFYGRSGGVYCNRWAGILQFTSDSLTANLGDASFATNGNSAAEHCPFNWIPLVMRLKAGSKEVVSFDICQGKETTWISRNPTSYMVEGSQDGVNWQVLNDTPYNENWSLPGCTNWYSNGDRFVSGDIRKVSEGKGFAIAGHPEVSSLPNVRSIRVDTGATLKTSYENVGAIKALKVSAVGGGTIDGFKFAANGTVDLVDSPEKGAVDMPITIVNDGGTAANIANWPITVGGAPQTRRHAMFTGTSFRLVPHGATISFR